MRRAAVQASLIPDNDDGHGRIQFVTEGEASLHFCIQNGLTTDAMKVSQLWKFLCAQAHLNDLSLDMECSSSTQEEGQLTAVLTHLPVTSTPLRKYLLPNVSVAREYHDFSADIPGTLQVSSKAPFS